MYQLQGVQHQYCVMGKFMVDMTTFGPKVPGLKLLNRGKVRDSYELPGHDDLMLVVASDRISIFDFVLGDFVRDKGEILTALKVFWDKALLNPNGVLTDFVAAGAEIDKYLPKAQLNKGDLHARAVVVRKLEMIPVECIIRGYLTGSGLTAYKETAPKHLLCGHSLPPGLVDGSQFDNPLFTPTTKVTVGHDEHITAQSVDEKYGGELGDLAWEIYKVGRIHAALRQVIIADTKFEFGYDKDRRLVLGDEYLTPDSSRFWDETDWNLALREGRTPKSHDKEFVRTWGRTLGIQRRKPEVNADYAWVREQYVPKDVLAQTTGLYHTIFERLTQMPLATFQREFMGM